MSISQPPFQSTLVDANDRVQTPWAQWFSQLQPILQSVAASGPTSGRPTQNLYIGYPYFDTTIDQMIYWNGVIWVTYAPSTTGNAILYGNGAGGFSSVSIGSGVTFAGGVLSATGSGGTVSAVTGTAPIASSGGTTPAISISQAGTATDGYLSSIDWNTFNNKGSGTVTAVTGSGNIASSGGTTPDITFTGTLPIANGGTNGTATPTAGAVAVGNGTQYAFTAAGSAGQVLTSNGSTVPTWATVATGIGTTGYWGSFWDTTNQTAASTTVAYTINIGTSDPNNNGVSIVSSNRITVAYAGIYNIQYSIQFENIGTGNKNYNVDVWFRLNGVDIPDSNSTYWIASKNSTVNGELIATVNYVLSLAAGDYIQLMWAVSDVDISIATISATSSPTVPRTPGVIVTVTPITEVGIGYYNLTSVSSVAIATGSKTFTTNLSNISTAFTVGTRIRVAYVTTPANYMEGVITSFSGTTLVVNVDSIGGSGTYANWTISVAGIQGSNGVTSITGTANQVIASVSTGAVTLSLPQSINSGAAPTFTGTNFTGIPNAGLTNSTITFGATAQALGSTVSALNAVTIGASSQTTGAFTTVNATTRMGIGSLGTSSLNIVTTPAITDSFMVTNSPAYTSANTFGTIYYSQPTIASGGALTNVTHYRVGQGTFTGTATNQYGFAVNPPMVGATNNYAFYGNLPQATGNWNVYATGAGANYFGGNVLLGTTTQPTTSNNLVVAGLKATSAAAPTIASATTIAPTKAITFISGVASIVTITAPNPISVGGGQITLIPTGIFTTTVAGNIALASTAVVGKALIMTYDTTTAKWYPSY